MKTLDEVITAVHHCGLITSFDDTYEYDGGCPYEDCSECEKKRMLGKDIIQYLAAYKDDKDDLTALRAFWKEQQENPPLDWKTLKTMLGQPVWLVYDWNNVHYKGWILLDHLEDIFILDAKDNWALSEANMDKWKAYRKERG